MSSVVSAHSFKVIEPPCQILTTSFAIVFQS